MARRNKLDLGAIRTVLEAERDELHRLSRTGAQERKPVELDQQSIGRLSRMDALQVQAMAQSVEERRQNRLKRIAQALKRLAEDEYGTCLTCGERIAPKRLAADPTVTQCVDCAA